MVRQEKPILDYFHQRFPHHENRLLEHPEVQNDRLAFNHAQLGAALDCLAKAMAVDGKSVITPAQVAEGHELITQMCLLQHGALGADHPAVVQFWENFDFLNHKLCDGKLEIQSYGLNHHRKHDQGLIAVSMPELEQMFGQYRIQIPTGTMLELKKLLKTSKTRKFNGDGQVNCRDGKNRHCWLFIDTKHQEALPV